MSDAPAATPSVTPTAPAAAPPPSATGGTGTAPAPTSEWTAGFSDETKGFIQNKGWKSAQDLADSYKNLEKLVGVKDKLLQLPESWESPEAQAVWEKLGKPKDPKGYNLKVPEKGDAQFVEWASDAFHKSNLTATQAEKVMSAFNERQAAIASQTEANMKQAQTMAVADLKTEWGAAFDKNINLVDQAAKVLGWDDKKVNALKGTLGPKDAAKMLLDIANSVSESKFVGGRPAPDGTVTPEQAKAQIADLKRDSAFMQRYLAGDFDAQKRFTQLHQMAAPGEGRLT